MLFNNPSILSFHFPVLCPISSFLDEVSGAGEAAQEFLELFCALTEDEKGKWKLYLAQKSVLLQIGNLIGKVGHMSCSLSRDSHIPLW